jgi:hypothetical protein
MSGAVFHPGHDDYHGITVVLYTSGPRTFIGRWDQVMDGMIRIVGATMHDGKDPAKPMDVWVQETKKYGVPPDFPQLMIPKSEVTKVVPLREA